MSVSPKFLRFAAFFSVVLLVAWTTRSSHDTYKFLSRPNSWMSHGEEQPLKDEEPPPANPDAPSALDLTEGGVVYDEGKMEDPQYDEYTPIITSEASTETASSTQILQSIRKSESQRKSRSRILHTTTQIGVTATADSELPVTTTTHTTSTTTNDLTTTTDQPDLSSADFTTSILDSLENQKAAEGNGDSQTAVDTPQKKPGPEGQEISYADIKKYVAAILNLNRTIEGKLECPGEQEERPRYEVLRNIHKSGDRIKYLFSMDLFQAIEVVPRLMGTVVQVAKFLGPENCGISIIEGRSTDGTYNVLEGLSKEFTKLGISYWLQQSDIDPKGGSLDRVGELAKLRNMALQPLLNQTQLFSRKPLVIFINDIVPCPDDVYEMIYQHELQGAVQTCAMDWIEKGENFYDVWVSRTMSGNTFWEIPQDGSWRWVHNLFFDDPISKDKFTRGVPFQVFSCWGGMTVIDALPFMYDELEFRRNVDGECYAGEPQLLASDLAKLGMNKVQTIPAVNVGYNNLEGGLVKAIHQYVHERIDMTQLVEKFEDDTTTERIKWLPPPPRIRCMPSFTDAWWVDPWYDPEKETAQA